MQRIRAAEPAAGAGAAHAVAVVAAVLLLSTWFWSFFWLA
jgi:hypothetical protein